MTLFKQGDELASRQDKDAFLDYSIDWADWLAASTGDTISTSVWATDPALTLTSPSASGTVTSVWVQGGQPWTWYAVTNTVTSAQGRRDQRTIRLHIVDEGGSDGSLLFGDRAATIARLRRDRLMMMATSLMPGVDLSDDFLWDKLRAAEAEIAHTLRVPLVPTHFFPIDPTQAQIDALPVGMPWDIDPPYDYNPSDYYGDKWGMIQTRQKPIQSVVAAKLNYPGPASTIVDIPSEWLRVERKYGHVQLVPTGTSFTTMMGGMFMTALSGGKTLPLSVHLEYVAGLANVHKDYPDLIDLVLRLAVTKMVDDAFLPASGSISADGLSQSISNDASKYHDAIDRAINGQNGNGGLMARIHGIRLGVL